MSRGGGRGKTHPSSICTKSITTQPEMRTFLPITQCRPTTLFLTLVRSPTFVDAPMRESDEIWAFGLTSPGVGGGEGTDWAAMACALRNWVAAALLSVEAFEKGGC